MALTEYKFAESDFSGKKIADLSDTPSSDGMTAADLKERFDLIPKVLIALGKYNELIDALTTLGIDSSVISGDLSNIKYIRLNDDNVIEVSADGVIWSQTASSGHIFCDYD